MVGNGSPCAPRHSRTGPYAAVLMAAKGMGDQQVYAAVNEAIHSQAKTRIEEGELIYQGCSNFTSFMLAVAAFGRPAAFHDLLRTGMPEAWRSGPLLALISGTKHRSKSWQRPRLHHALPAKH